MRQWHIPLLLMSVLVLALAGCAGKIYPITSGFSVPEMHAASGIKLQRYLIWSNHPGAANRLATMLMAMGNTVVERSRLDQVMAEQRLRLVWTPEREADLLHVGRLVGATQLLFVEAKFEKLGYWTGAPTRVGVLMRSVDVETARVYWSGSGHYPDTPADPDQAASSLAGWTMFRALCPIDLGYVWTDPSSAEGGCTNPRQVKQTTRY